MTDRAASPRTESDLEEIPDPGPEMFGGMLNSIMANYFEYEHSDGNTLNLAEVLLLIRQSIDHSTEAIKQLTKTLEKNNGKTI